MMPIKSYKCKRRYYVAKVDYRMKKCCLQVAAPCAKHENYYRHLKSKLCQALGEIDGYLQILVEVLFFGCSVGESVHALSYVEATYSSLAQCRGFKKTKEILRIYNQLLGRASLEEEIASKSSHPRLDLADFGALIQQAYKMKGLFFCFNSSLVFPCKGASFFQLHTLWARCSKEGGIVTSDKWRLLLYTWQQWVIPNDAWRGQLHRTFYALGSVVLVALYDLRFMLVFVLFSVSRCRPLYKASLETF